MNEKFTPGPWEADATHCRTAINSVATANNCRKHIAMVNITKNQEYEITAVEHNANATLIAAAPDLFEHLVYAIECVSFAIVPNSQWLERANAAIKKARGEV